MDYGFKPRVRAEYLKNPLFKGMSLRELESKSGVNRTQVARLLRGETSPSRVQEAVLKALGCSAEELQKAL